MIPMGPVLAELFKTLKEIGIPFVVGGSFASGAWGNPRQTNDIDIAVQMTPESAHSFLQALGEDWISSRREILETLNDSDEYRMFQLLHAPSVFKVDVFVPHRTEYSDLTFDRAQVVDFLGIEAPCLSAEDIVLHKLRWFEFGNRVSDRQWNDIVQVLELRRDLVDTQYLMRWATHFGVQELLQSAWSQTRNLPS